MVNKSKQKGYRWEHDLVEILQNTILESKVKRIAGSGAIGTTLGEPMLQGDIVAKFIGFPKPFRIECKTGFGGETQLTLKREWLNKIKEEALNSNAVPLLACKFSGARKIDGVQMFVALDIYDFCGIINYVDDLKKELDRIFIEYAKK